MSKHVILVTGASSGFGLMTARALAQAGDTVYASMRETKGRNAPQVATVNAWAAEQKTDLRTVELDVQSDVSAEAGVAHILGTLAGSTLSSIMRAIRYSARPRLLRRSNSSSSMMSTC